jgi:hypothetical protein
VAARIANRLASRALSVGALELAEATPQAAVLAFVASSPGESVLVAINFSAREVDASVKTPRHGGGQLTLAVPPWSAVQAVVA